MTAKMENLSVFVDIILVAFAGASVTNLFDDCIQDGMIFGRYGNWLRKDETFNNYATKHNEMIREYQNNTDSNSELNKEIEYVDGKFWKKPIGGCIICTNTWITLIMLIFYKFILIVFVIFAIIGVSNTFLKKIIA